MKRAAPADSVLAAPWSPREFGTLLAGSFNQSTRHHHLWQPKSAPGPSRHLAASL